MKVLITGSNGQLGYELQRTVPQKFELLCVDKDQLDITSASAVQRFFEKHQPDALINAAAYTAVDKAETEQTMAYAVNAEGPRFLAQACADLDIPMVQLSTDFVFDGKKATPYKPEDNPNALSVYGDSKLKGELAVQEVLPHRSLVIRTSWVYSAHGNNFVKTIVRLLKEKDQLGVIADQVGTPTWARALAEVCWKAISELLKETCKKENKKSFNAIYHWSDAGIASWYDFAVAIQEEAAVIGLLEGKIPIKPLSSCSYPTKARRPAYSVLSKERVSSELLQETTHWRENLREMLAEYSVVL